MKKYRKIPVVIEAVQFNVLSLVGAVNFHNELPIKAAIKWDDYDDYELNEPPATKIYLEIETLEGVMRVSHMDWIIKGIEGEFYSCKPSIFSKTYEAA